MKWICRIILVIIFTLIFIFTNLNITTDAISVLYTLCGILFPLGISQTLSFPFSEIPNDDFVKKYRSNIANVRTVFVVLFLCLTLFYAIVSFVKEQRFVLCFTFAFCLYTITHFSLNFLKLTKLKDEIDDLIRKQKK